MAEKQNIRFQLDDAEVKQILRAFRRLDKEANTRLKDLSRNIAGDIAVELKNAARGAPFYSDQAEEVARTIRVARDRVPSVAVGGSKRFTNRRGQRVPVGLLVTGSEFGSVVPRQRERFRRPKQPRGGLQFPPRSPRQGRGNRGWWLFPRLRRLQPDILRRWLQGAQRVADEWGRSS